MKHEKTYKTRSLFIDEGFEGLAITVILRYWIIWYLHCWDYLKMLVTEQNIYYMTVMLFIHLRFIR